MDNRHLFQAWIKPLKLLLPVVQIAYDCETITVDLSGQGDISEYSFDEVELMQCTGLTDKNGTLIFEGNIFELGDGCQFKVVWDSDNARFMGVRIKASPERTICYVGYQDKNGKSAVEVIGNIYEKEV